MKFGYVVRNPIAHAFTVGIFEIIFVEGEKRNYMKTVQVEVSISSPSL